MIKESYLNSKKNYLTNRKFRLILFKYDCNQLRKSGSNEERKT